MPSISVLKSGKVLKYPVQGYPVLLQRVQHKMDITTYYCIFFLNASADTINLNV